jgi:hypothetical protein
MCLLDPPVEAVYERLRERGGTAWWNGSREQIWELLQEERAHAEEVATVTCVPLERVGTSSAALATLLRCFETPG